MLVTTRVFNARRHGLPAAAGRLLGFAVLALAMLAPWAAARADYKPAASVLQLVHHVHVRADGSHVSEEQRSLRVETEQALDWIGEQRFTYSSSLERFEVLEAWTTTPGGQRLDVEPSKIRTLEESDTGEAMFSDKKVRVVIFPGLAVGGSIHYRIRREQHTPYFPGHFAEIEGVSPYYRVDAFEYNLTHEPGIDLRVVSLPARYDPNVKGPAGGRVEPLPTDAPGTVRYRYTWRQPNVLPPEEGTVALSQFMANISVSSFPDFATVGQEYQRRARPKALVTPAIRQMALELTQGAGDTREKVRRLYHWVSREIRYVSVALAHGGFVPNDAATVLERRFGDCKDHVVLLEALLRAVGIESTPALINAGERYRLHALPMPLFDHVITYVPALDLYLDPTAGFAPMGTLPSSVSGKPVVLTATGAISQTPATHPQRDVTHVRSTLRLADDGSVHGQAEMRYQGSHEVGSRAWYFSIADQEMKDVVSDVLSGHQETGTGRIHPADPGDLNKPWVLRSEFVLDPVVNLPGPQWCELKAQTP